VGCFDFGELEYNIWARNFMAKKLHLVSETPSIEDPPPNLEEAGKNLWNRITGAYDISDEGGRELLRQCCYAADRAESLRRQIDEAGELLITRSGLREHPGLRHELAARAFICRTLSRLGLDVEPLRSTAGRPPQWRG
jgi:hypothetical protein